MWEEKEVTMEEFFDAGDCGGSSSAVQRRVALRKVDSLQQDLEHTGSEGTRRT